MSGVRRKAYHSLADAKHEVSSTDLPGNRHFPFSWKKSAFNTPRRATRHLDRGGDRNRSQRRSKSRQFEWYVIGRAMNRASMEYGKKSGARR